MSRERSAAGWVPERPTGPDLEYDLAHERASEAGWSSQGQVSRQVTVATGTPEYDGDYSYDLAHDIRAADVMRRDVISSAVRTL